MADYALAADVLKLNDNTNALAEVMGEAIVVTRDSIGSFESQAALASYTGTPPEAVILRSYATPDDFGGALYRLKAAPEANSPGQVVTPNGARYEYAEGDIRIRAFGAVGDGVANDQPAIQRAVDFAVYRDGFCVLRADPGTYRLGAQVDLSLVTKRGAILGAAKETTVFIPDAFGASKAVFKLPPVPFQVHGFQITGPGGDNRPHPMGIYAPDAGRLTIGNITIGSLGNTAIWASRPFNCDWTDLDLLFNGFQPIWKEVSAGSITASYTAGGAAVTLSGAVVDAEDIGKEVVFYLSAAENSGFVTTIATVTDATNFTVATPFPLTNAASRFSFMAVRGAVTSGSPALVAEKSIFTNDDLGRFLYIDGAGADGGLLVTRVAAVVSGTTVTLANAASTTVASGRIYFTPTLALSGYESPGSTPINDIVISNLMVEGFKGPGIVAVGGTHLFFNNLKTHGRTWGEYSNFGMSCESFILSGVNRVVIDGWEHEFCCPGVNGAPVRINGGAPGLYIDGMTVNAPAYGGYLFDFSPTDTNLANLCLGAINTRAELTRFQGVVKTPSSAVLRRVYANGPLFGATVAGEASAQLPQMIGSVRSVQPVSIADDGVFSFRPASPAGMISVAAEDTGGFSGLFHFRSTNTPQATLYSGGAQAFGAAGVLTGTTGTDGRLTVSVAADGRAYVENRTGTSRRFYIGVLG